MRDEALSVQRFSDDQRLFDSVTGLFSTFVISLPLEPCSILCLCVCDSLSEFSDENMMDPYNLAICFGPTLLPVPSDRDQVQYQSHIIEVVRTVITHQDELFSRLDPAPDYTTLYERCLVENHRYVYCGYISRSYAEC